eukprot:3671831-Alexandrium_andersonii.AAC.1
MSASLVGSEMCIRDRRNRSSIRPRGPPSGPTCSLSMWLRSGLLQRTAGAVSYTHLTLPTICSV